MINRNTITRLTLVACAIGAFGCSSKKANERLDFSAIEGTFDPLEPCFRAARVTKGEIDTIKRAEKPTLKIEGYRDLSFSNAEIDDYENFLLSADISKDGVFLGTVNCEYDANRQLTNLTMTSPTLKLDNFLTWDDETANLINIKQKRTIYDENQNVIKELQEDVSFVYSKYSAFSNWSNGLARYMIGDELQTLFYDGVLGRASWTLPTEIDYIGVDVENFMIKEQYQKHGEITYVKDKNGLVVEEHFFNPNEKNNDYIYKYTRQIME